MSYTAIIITRYGVQFVCSLRLYATNELFYYGNAFFTSHKCMINFTLQMIRLIDKTQKILTNKGPSEMSHSDSNEILSGCSTNKTYIFTSFSPTNIYLKD